MKMKKTIAMLALTSMFMGTCCVMAEEPETTQETAAEEQDKKEERDYNPESGTGWLSAEINGETVEFEFKGMTKGMTGTTYNFESEGYVMGVMFNKALEVDTPMEENAITQIEIISSLESTSGYYFSKKSSKEDVESTATLIQKTDDGLLQGEFTVTVLSGDRYVGDSRPGILPELEITDGEFCFCE